MASTLLNRLSAPQLTVISFLFLSFSGALALYISERSSGLPFIDALFTAVSATCVTGLLTVDFSQFTLVGQIITLLLIQIGGISVIAFLRLIWFGQYLEKGFLSHRVIGEIVDFHGPSRTVLHFIWSTFKITLAIELVGASILYLVGTGDFPHRLWNSIFISVSAFNNAGISPDPENLVPFQSNYLFAGMVSLLILAGGIGYPVLIGIERLGLLVLRRVLEKTIIVTETIIMQSNRFESLLITFYTAGESIRIATEDKLEEIRGHASSVQIKLVLLWTVFLILAGMLLFYFIEFHSIRQMESPLFQSYFMSVTARTAGFNLIDTTGFLVPTFLFLTILMFIGAAPQGTAGGIKVTTFAIVLTYIRDSFKGFTRVKIFKTIISRSSVSNAVKLYVMSTTMVLFLAFILTVLNPDFPFVKILFDSVSAFGTVGLSSGFCSSDLDWISKSILIALMLIGRINLINIGAAIFPQHKGPAGQQLTDDGVKLQVG